jgi:hypothetical protein
MREARYLHQSIQCGEANILSGMESGTKRWKTYTARRMMDRPLLILRKVSRVVSFTRASAGPVATEAEPRSSAAKNAAGSKRVMTLCYRGLVGKCRT